jgi:O-antigen ligase
MWHVLMRSWPLVLFTFLPLVSTLWSQAPDTTLRRAVALILTSTFAVFLAARFNMRSVFSLLAISFGIFVVIGVLAAAVPGEGITPSGPYAGAWRGFTGQKNSFGRVLGLAVALLPVGAAFGLVRRRKSVVLVGVLAVILLVLSRSATSLVAALGCVPAATVLYTCLGGKLGGIRLRPELGIPFLLIMVITGVLVISMGWTVLLEGLGRDPTLTGRTDLWHWALSVNKARFWLGSGYKAFWISENTKYFFEAFYWHMDSEGNRSDTYSGPTHAHSGYIDVRLELGIVGTCFLVMTVVGALISMRYNFTCGSSSPGFVLATTLSFQLILSITEAGFLQHSEILSFLAVLFYLFSVKDRVLAAKADSGALVFGFGFSRIAYNGRITK